jgi:ribonuclease HI
MGGGPDERRQEPRDVGIKSVDYDLRDGALAAVEAFCSIPEGSSVQLCSDSELLIHGMRFYVGRWQSQGWRNSRGMELQHQGLWKELLTMNGRMNIRWQWIRGHSGHPVPARADALAYRAARSQWCNLPAAA